MMFDFINYELTSRQPTRWASRSPTSSSSGPPRSSSESPAAQGAVMRALIQWVRRRLTRPPAQTPGHPPSDMLGDDESIACRVCDGSGLCRVCNGQGVIERLVAIAGADSGMVREPAQQIKTVKCRACPSSSGVCKACNGRGRVSASA